MAQNINIVPCSTLHALAMTPNFTASRNVLVISDARQNEVYWSCVRLSAERQIEEIIIEHKVTKPSDVSVPKGTKWCVVSSRWSQYEEFLPSYITTLPRTTCVYPSALPIAKFARYSLQRQKKFSPAEAMPVYLRSPIKEEH
jgi:tRNA A37 threonylcarbamoyladenosine modification protein TsaB